MPRGENLPLPLASIPTQERGNEGMGLSPSAPYMTDRGEKSFPLPFVYRRGTGVCARVRPCLHRNERIIETITKGTARNQGHSTPCLYGHKPCQRCWFTPIQETSLKKNASAITQPTATINLRNTGCEI